MLQFKHTLDKSSKKFVCPKCNKRTFVLYIETETGNYLAVDFGRCDRETECGYFAKPTGEKQTFEFINIPPPPPTSFHDYNLVFQAGKNFKQNNFVHFLKTLFTESEVQEAILKYLIGTSKHWNGAVVFWQIDNFERVHAGKILQYNSEIGKRAKDENGKPLINWVHSVLKFQKTISEFNLKQCLFGLHLINERNTKIIAVVESEKTAVIMSIFKPDYIWVATGSKSGFKHEYLKPIKDYKIIAFPDKSEFYDWHDTATKLNGFGYNIIVNDWLENKDCDAGTDFADLFIIGKEISQQPKYSNTEKIIHRWLQNISEIRELISTFDLIDSNGKEIRII